MHTGIPAVVTEYNSTLQSAKVKPVISQRDENGTIIEYPVIGDIPVHFPGGTGTGGQTTITHPIAKGDYVWLSFAEVSIDDWLSLGGPSVVPDSIRRFQVSDCIAVPGVRPLNPNEALPATATDIAAIVLYGPSVKVGDSTASSPVSLDILVRTAIQELANHLATKTDGNNAPIGYPPTWVGLPPAVPSTTSSKLFTND